MIGMDSRISNMTIGIMMFHMDITLAGAMVDMMGKWKTNYKAFIMA